jgi:SagB-type dehydrogenase family enzyme
VNPRLHDLDRARAYHEASKHTWQSVRRPGRRLDWANQPSPFRWFAGAPAVALDPRPAPLASATQDVLGRLLAPLAGPAPAIDLELVARLLHHSVAISAWKEQRTRSGEVARWSLRVNPSSGNLHPTETYVALRGASGLEDGLWHYRVDRHELELRRRGDAVSALLGAAGRSSDGIAIVIAHSSIAWREAWKYETRAYRYCALDAGHAAHAVLLAARALGLAGGVVARFDDAALARALAAPDDETPYLLLPLGAPGALAPLATAGAVREVALGDPLGRPNQLSNEVADWPLVDAIAQATELDGEDLAMAPAPLERRGRAAEPPAFQLPDPAPLAAPLSQVVRRRRSALDFDRERSALTLPELCAILRVARAPFPFDATRVFWGSPLPSEPRDGILVHAWAHAVEGLQGMHRVSNDGRALAPVRADHGRAEAQYLSLEQEIAGDGALALSIAADLEAHLSAQGCRGYRDAFVLAGAIGHALYLAATALGAGATGIGAFYDDDTIRDLALEADTDGQPLYHFSIGAPVPDERLR